MEGIRQILEELCHFEMLCWRNWKERERERGGGGEGNKPSVLLREHRHLCSVHIAWSSAGGAGGAYNN